MNKIYNEAIKKIDLGETVIGYLECSILTFVYRREYRPGIMIATNKRLFFYSLILGIEYTDSFLYSDILSIEKKKGLLKETIIMRVNEDIIKLSYIRSENIDEFLNIVKNKI
ncbi:hypothetical protein EXM36_18725 [Clostridium botulinum]|uniref:PH domain-containing protein n=1 Tax=Clostridium botulinum TaxID=1491 RepID=UPI000A16FCA5|nr:PH domain-containing protein [Clostridium botulinum]HDR5605918.1 PH domain-containing protein [Bacillus anthracis]NEZ73673.1 hypothetical protein [Clostridium botulinum]NFA40961.1 hypothetical protein [Clostridium botulinum]NFA75958.1 hypothetical protein [Clostridium botulinum]NFB51202.1 hypothetical protein [Clostridium botulinum]